MGENKFEQGGAKPLQITLIAGSGEKKYPLVFGVGICASSWDTRMSYSAEDS